MKAVRALFYALPVSWRYTVRRLWFLPGDLWDQLSGKRDAMIPPKGMIYTGSGDFKQQGITFFQYLREYADLRPEHAVLDVGCGIGRLAVPLTQFLDTSGRYEGFDVVQKGIDWCQRQITPRYPNFQFQYVALANDLYTDDGAEAAQFQFPYEDHSFDVVFLISVFTHMVPEEVEHYLKEIHRVLKPGGRVLSTFFILNDRSREAMRGSEFDFTHNHGHYRLLNPHVKSANVAFEEDYLRSELLEANGLTLEHQLHGYWSGIDQSQATDFQDMIVARKA